MLFICVVEHKNIVYHIKLNSFSCITKSFLSISCTKRANVGIYAKARKRVTTIQIRPVYTFLSRHSIQVLLLVAT